MSTNKKENSLAELIEKISLDNISGTEPDLFLDESEVIAPDTTIEAPTPTPSSGVERASDLGM